MRMETPYSWLQQKEHFFCPLSHFWRHSRMQYVKTFLTTPSPLGGPSYKDYLSWVGRPQTEPLVCRSAACCFACSGNYNLVPRVLRLFGQRGGARRDSGIMEFLIPENVGFRSLCACLRLKRKSNAPKWQPRYCYWAWRFYRALKVFEKPKIDSTRDQRELDFFP